MTDARLRGEWLGLMKFDDLSDLAWRVFTAGLMWSAEQGTDGFIPNRYLRSLHPDGEQPKAVAELETAGFWIVLGDGVQFGDWDGALGQSTALQVETAKANARERQRRHRENERTKLARRIGYDAEDPRPRTSDSATGDVTRDVGEGTGKGEGKEIKPQFFETKTQSEPVIDWPVAAIPVDDPYCSICGGAVPCRKTDRKHQEAQVAA